MSKNENKGFHTLRARSEDKLPDLLEFRCRLDAKTDGIHFIKEVIDRLWWRMYIRLKQPRFEPLASHDRFARSKLYMGFDFIAPMFGIRVEDIHVKAVIIDITAYLPRLAQLLNAYQSDKTTGVSRFCHDDWKRIWIALSMLSEAAPTVSEALTLAAILKWTSTDNALSSNDAQTEFCNDFLQFCEDAYSSELFSAATRLTNAVKDGDIESAVTELLSIRANFVLEAELLSSQHAQKVAAIFDQIAVSFEALKAKATTAAEALVVELSSSVLSMKWRDASQACTAVSDFIEHENLGHALDVEHYVINLKLLRSAAFAAFLYAGPANLSLTKREDSDDYKRLLEMQDELEYEFLPTGSLHTLLQLIRANEVSEVVLQTKSLSVDNLIADVRKTARYLLPQGYMTEYLTSAELWSFRIKEDDAEDALLGAKFFLDWFAPPLISWALRISEDDAVRAVLESGNLFKKAKALRGLGLEFCTKLLRSLDQLQPDHPPILFGHVINFYFDIIVAHGSVPSDNEELQKVIEELYVSKANNVRDRLQKSLLHLQALSVIEKVETDEAKNFVRRCYERSGIIVTDEFCAQLGKSAVPSLLATGPLSVTHLPIPSNMAKGWDKYHDRYSGLKGIDTLAVLADKFIAKEARALVGRINEAAFTEKNPLRNFTSPRVPKGLTGHGDIIDVLIQRRAVLRWAQVCELRRVDKAKSQNRKRFFQQMGYGTGNLESYSNYFNAIGLKLENLYVPDESGFFPEELTWLSSFRTRKKKYSNTGR